MTTDRYRRGRLADPATAPNTGEALTELLAADGVVIEQILSSGEVTPTDYDQPHDEWVVLLDGAATMVVDGDRLDLQPGDHLFLPAHVPHRVETTAAGTRWLAVHIKGRGSTW